MLTPETVKYWCSAQEEKRTMEIKQGRINFIKLWVYALN
jgi:hypothetical protein